jgi:predicted Zn-dependent protease
VVKPVKPLEGKPWVWRAHFLEWHTDADSNLLSRGFHVAYVNTNDMFGAPAAMQIWNAFHAYMVSKGFAERVALEGVSRGGLYIYNWSKRNPLKVACIYAEAQQTIEQFYGINTTAVKATTPESASAHDRGRYNANRILDYLQQQYPNQKVIALTLKDICTNKNGIPCWGIFGLTYLGKPYSVSSVHRIKSDKTNQLSKVAINELGHSLGIPHCKSGNPCLM